MDQIQEKKTTKSTIRNKSKSSSFVPSLSHLQKPYDNLYQEIILPLRNKSMKHVNSKQVCLVGHFLVIFFIVWPSGSLIEFKSRADSTFKSRMCRGILRDVFFTLYFCS